MKTITLTPAQRKQLNDAIYDNATEGNFDFVIEIDDMEIYAECYLETDGYYDNDYFTGTGDWIETSRYSWVYLTAYVGDNHEECAVDAESKREAERTLQDA